MAAGEGKPILAPDDLRSDLEAGGLQCRLGDAGEPARMPDIGDIAGRSAHASRQSARSSFFTWPSLRLLSFTPRSPRHSGW